MAQMAPLFFLGFFGGVLADRVDRRLLLIGGMGIGTVATAALAALSVRCRRGPHGVRCSRVRLQSR